MYCYLLACRTSFSVPKQLAHKLAYKFEILSVAQLQKQRYSYRWVQEGSMRQNYMVNQQFL
jgi:hypothetical protein